MSVQRPYREPGIDVTEYSLRLVRVDTGDVAASFEDKTPTWLGGVRTYPGIIADRYLRELKHRIAH